MSDKYPPDYPRYGFHMCHGCGAMAPHHSQENAPDNGWDLPYESFGYYAGFTDSERPTDDKWRLCHDCVIKFLDTFPLLGMLIPKGQHTMLGPSDIPCCRWAWRGTDLFGKYENGEPVPGVHIQLANEEGGWDNSEW